MNITAYLGDNIVEDEIVSSLIGILVLGDWLRFKTFPLASLQLKGGSEGLRV